MEKFVKDNNAVANWNDDLQAKLVQLFDESFETGDWPAIETLAIASREGSHELKIHLRDFC